ncbi:MAG: glycosyltransferase family 2 protein [Niabella sp.]|nr:glycosyltransferase family 2 protein [Niabella sp.]
MRYSVIIVNYKTPQLVVQCLQSIYAGTMDAIEVIVVDNDSADNSEQLIKQAYPQVQWVQMGYNSGFARANNQGIRLSKGEIILLLNSDTINTNNTIYACFDRFSRDRFIACGVQLLNEDGSPQISGNFFMKGGLNYLMTLPYTGELIRRVAVGSGVKKTNVPEATDTIEVDWINGAFLMVRKSAIEKAGLMDEDFFLYSEESEWCSRLRKLGPLCIYGDLNIYHLEGGSSKDAFHSKRKGYRNYSDKKGLQIMVSNFLGFRKQYGIGWYAFHQVAHLSNIPVYFLIVLLKTLALRSDTKKEWTEWWGYTKNVLKALSLAPKIIANRPYFYKML